MSATGIPSVSTVRLHHAGLREGVRPVEDLGHRGLGQAAEEVNARGDTQARTLALELAAEGPVADEVELDGLARARETGDRIDEHAVPLVRPQGRHARDAHRCARPRRAQTHGQRRRVHPAVDDVDVGAPPRGDRAQDARVVLGDPNAERRVLDAPPQSEAMDEEVVGVSGERVGDAHEARADPRGQRRIGREVRVEVVDRLDAQTARVLERAGPGQQRPPEQARVLPVVARD